MELTATQIRYLLAIDQLNDTGAVRSADIADRLAVTRPSVHRMLTQLSGMGLLEKERYASAQFTAHGQDLAKRYGLCFARISKVLSESLRLPPASAEEAALAALSRLNTASLRAVGVKPPSENT